MKNHCLRVFGVPLDETLDGDEDANKFSMETLPRIAEVFLNRIDGVSLSKKDTIIKLMNLNNSFRITILCLCQRICNLPWFVMGGSSLIALTNFPTSNDGTN